MRVLILGSSGMLGHKLWEACRQRFETWITVRGPREHYARYSIFEQAYLLDGVDALKFDTVLQAFQTISPQVVVNCIGIVKQLPEASDPLIAIPVNSLFPHRLAKLCGSASTRMIHISTDCVFSGREGMRTESDRPDPVDLYGQTKWLGEVSVSGCLTLRTSMIGLELKSCNGLVEWLLSNHGSSVSGHTRAIFSGLTTNVLSRLIADLLEYHPSLAGLYHVASAPVSKYQLLCGLREAFNIPTEIHPDDRVSLDRSLNGSRFEQATGFHPPPWREMIRELAEGRTLVRTLTKN